MGYIMASINTCKSRGSVTKEDNGECDKVLGGISYVCSSCGNSVIEGAKFILNAN